MTAAARSLRGDLALVQSRGSVRAVKLSFLVSRGRDPEVCVVRDRARVRFRACIAIATPTACVPQCGVFFAFLY